MGPPIRFGIHVFPCRGHEDVPQEFQNFHQSEEREAHEETQIAADVCYQCFPLKVTQRNVINAHFIRSFINISVAR